MYPPQNLPANISLDQELSFWEECLWTAVSLRKMQRVEIEISLMESESWHIPYSVGERTSIIRRGCLEVRRTSRSYVCFKSGWICAGLQIWMYLWLYTMFKVSGRIALSNPIRPKSPTELHIICVRDGFEVLARITATRTCWFSRSELDGTKWRKSNSRKYEHRRALVLRFI